MLQGSRQSSVAKQIYRPDSRAEHIYTVRFMYDPGPARALLCLVLYTADIVTPRLMVTCFQTTYRIHDDVVAHGVIPNEDIYFSKKITKIRSCVPNHPTSPQ